MNQSSTIPRIALVGVMLASLAGALSALLLLGESPWAGRIWALLVASAGFPILLWHFDRLGRISLEAIDQGAWVLLISHTMIVYRSREITDLVENTTPTPAIAAEIGIWVLLIIYSLFRLNHEPRRLDLLFGTRARYASLLVIVAFASTFYALGPTVTFAWSVKLLCIVLLSCVIFDPRQPAESVRRFLDATYIGLLAILVFFVLFAILAPESAVGISPRTGILRLGGVILPAVSLSTVAGLATLMTFLRMISGRSSRRSKWILVFSGALLLGSLGRGGIFGTCVATLVGLVLLRKLRFAFTLALCAALLIATFPSLIDTAYTLATRRQSETELRSFTGRDLIWANSIDMIRERPLFGWGYVSGSRFGLAQAALKPSAHSHNALLEILVSLGLVGAILMMTLWWLTGYGVFATCRQSKGSETRLTVIDLCCLLVFLTAIGFFTPSFSDAPRYETAIFIGIATATDVLRQRGTKARVGAGAAPLERQW